MKQLTTYLLIFILSFAYCICVKAQQNSKNLRIKWSKSKPIEWDDFTGEPDYSDYRIAAITSSLIQYKYFCENNEIIFESSAIFVCNESWVKPENKNDKTLEHERLHFDITEYFSRMLSAKVAQKNWLCDEVNELENLINEVLKEWRDAQHRYDKDTWFSLNTKMQNEWNNLVEKNLNYE